MKLFLTGFMGSGKSTYGSRLAKQLKYDFLDLDEKIEEQAGQSIMDIFNTQGEEHFRKLEQQVLKSLSEMDQVVIATGGGTPCFFDNIQWMNTHGITIYLKMLDKELVKRLKKEQDQRPLLKGMDPDDIQQFVQQKMTERAYFYHQCHIAIDPLSCKPGLLMQQLQARYSEEK